MNRADTIRFYRSVAELPEPAVALMAERLSSRECLQLGDAWFLNLEREVFADESGITYVTLWEHDEPLAVLPLIVSGPAWARRVRALGNYYTCLYEPALRANLTASKLARAFEALRREYRGAGELNIAPMDPDAASFRILEQALALAGWRPWRYFCFGNWYLRADGGWSAYLAGRTSKLRSTIKRMAQRIAADQGTVEILSAAADVTRGVAAYDVVYANSWKVPEPSTTFIPGLIKLCATHGALRLGVIWLRGQPIAAQLWIVNGRRAEIYKVAYDERFKAYSPGTVLTARMMEHVLDHDGVLEVDYLIGDDAYKKTWMSDRRERWGIVAHNIHSPAGFVGLSIEGAKRAAKALIRATRPQPMIKRSVDDT